MTTKTPAIHVSDAQRAALILCLGGKLIDCQGRKGRRLAFIFDDSDGSATYAASAYLRNELVPIATYLECLRKTRELLWQYKLTIESENSPYYRSEAETKTEVANADNAR